MVTGVEHTVQGEAKYLLNEFTEDMLETEGTDHETLFGIFSAFNPLQSNQPLQPFPFWLD